MVSIFWADYVHTEISHVPDSNGLPSTAIQFNATRIEAEKWNNDMKFEKKRTILADNSNINRSVLVISYVEI